MKSIYEQFNGIEVNMDEINAINLELDELTKKRIKNNIRSSVNKGKNKSFLRKCIITIAAVFILVSLVMIKHDSMTVFAEKVPVLNTLFEKFAPWYGGDFQDYTEVIGETKVDKGYEVTLNEVVMDDFSFKLIYTIKCPENVEELTSKKGNPFPHTPGKSIKINGKDYLGGAGGTDRIIDDYTIQVIEDYDIEKQDIPLNLKVALDFGEINDVKGNWKFEFHVSKEKISKDIKTYTPNKQFKIRNNDGKEVTLNIEKASFSPISTAILLKSNGSFESYDIKVKDENGNAIESNYICVSAHNGKFTGLYKFKPVEKVPNKILIEYKDWDTGKLEEIALNLSE